MTTSRAASLAASPSPQRQCKPSQPLPSLSKPTPPIFKVNIIANGISAIIVTIHPHHHHQHHDHDRHQHRHNHCSHHIVIAAATTIRIMALQPQQQQERQLQRQRKLQPTTLEGTTHGECVSGQCFHALQAQGREISSWLAEPRLPKRKNSFSLFLSLGLSMRERMARSRRLPATTRRSANFSKSLTSAQLSRVGSCSTKLERLNASHGGRDWGVGKFGRKLNSYKLI